MDSSPETLIVAESQELSSSKAMNLADDALMPDSGFEPVTVTTTTTTMDLLSDLNDESDQVRSLHDGVAEMTNYDTPIIAATQSDDPVPDTTFESAEERYSDSHENMKDTIMNESGGGDTTTTTSKMPAAVVSSISPSAPHLDDPVIQHEHAMQQQKSAASHEQNPKIDDEDKGARIAEASLGAAAEGKSAAMMEQVTSSTENTGCPFSPSAWFDPNRLHPVVEKLVYWRDPKKSGIVFGSVLLILLSLTYFSLISIIAYLSLAALSVSISFRIYKNVIQAVQKSGEGHPYKEYLEMDINAPRDTVIKVVDILIEHYNSTANKLRSVFLVEDLVDSLKFVIMLWCLTYVGAWFNGLTLLILAYVAAFTLPKFYETNKAQIDQYINLVNAQVNDIMGKIRAKIPLGKKKEQ